jgi:hypothetical protein
LLAAEPVLVDEGEFLEVASLSDEFADGAELLLTYGLFLSAFRLEAHERLFFLGLSHALEDLFFMHNMY